MNIANLVLQLRNKDNKIAYQSLKDLIRISEINNSLYPHFDELYLMISDSNSYIRTRGILLISALSKWDSCYKIDEIIDEFLTHIMDESPITARQTIGSLPKIAEYKPDLRNDICTSLKNAKPFIYPSSMRGLVEKDIQNALNIIENL